MSLKTPNRYPPILLVEDDDLDTELVKCALEKNCIKNTFFRAKDGVEAWELLETTDLKKKYPAPLLILLDINMPRMNGLQFLKKLRNHTHLKESIVFILTTSSQECDLKAAYEHNAAGYVLKDNTLSLINLISNFCKINEFSDYL